MKYRPEIDGLRAIAVIPVILFHAGFDLFSGGYVGVDVFFVVSGYLITRLLLNDLDAGTFSIIDFYDRRARRILPALFLVMAACIPFSWGWMTAAQFRDFSESVVAASLFSSNILFWVESGYFDQSVDLKPLIHTWSLGVEEQFYIIFPILLAAIYAIFRKGLTVFLIGLALVSFMASDWVLAESRYTSFYLSPFRVWELLAGSLVAIWLRANDDRDSRPWDGLLAMAGLFLIFIAVFAYDASTPFPGRNALLPVVGTVVFIAFCKPGTLMGYLTTRPWIIWIGLGSYSLYLWHQPLFALARIRVGTLSMTMIVILIGVSCLLSYLSWRLVEQPFRRRDGFSRKTIFISSAMTMIVFSVIGLWGTSVRTPVAEEGQTPAFSGPMIDGDVWIVGDSHAGHLVSGIKTVTLGTVTRLHGAGCIPFRDVDRYDSRFNPGDCVVRTNTALDRIIAEDPEAVVLLSTMGPVYIDNESFKGKDPARIEGQRVVDIRNPELSDHAQVFRIGLDRTMRELSTLKRARIVFAVDVPELGIDQGCNTGAKEVSAPWIRLTHSVNADAGDRVRTCRSSRIEYDRRAVRYREIVDEILPHYPDIEVFDPVDDFCGPLFCKGYDDEFGYLYRDVDHLSLNGSEYFARNFARWLARNQE